jgi:hypothetical protein
MSVVLRVTIPAVIPDALALAAVETCEPGWPLKSHVASTPENTFAQLPLPLPLPLPVGGAVAQIALPPPVGCMQV